MNKRPDFAADLSDVQQDVNENVSTILSVVKERNSQRRSRPTPSGSLSNDMNHPATPATPRPRRVSSPRKAPRVREQSHELTLVNVTTRLVRDTKELLAEAALR